jgi:hypothetical protein
VNRLEGGVQRKTLWQELFARRRNGRMAPFLKGLLVAGAYVTGALVSHLPMPGGGI